MASKIRKFLDIQGLLKLIRLVKNNEQPHWIGTQAEYDSQKANIPNGAIVALTDEEDTTYDHGKYATVETVTGKRWIDGKPIYRKVIQTTLPAQSVSIEPSTGIAAGVIDSLVSLSTTIERTDQSASNRVWWGSDYASGNSTSLSTVNAYLNRGGTTVYLINYGGWPAGCRTYIIFEYTKTTD